MVLLVDKVLADIKDIKSCKQIRAFDLKELGYLLSKKRIKVYNTSYEVCEVLDIDTRQPASFCFLMPKKQLMGIILANTYRHYLFSAREDSEKGPDETKDRTVKKANPSSNRNSLNN